MEGIVDRFEGDKVLLEVEKEIHILDKKLFPANIEEGDIVSCVDNKIIIKKEKTKKRKKYINNLFDSLTEDK